MLLDLIFGRKTDAKASATSHRPQAAEPDEPKPTPGAKISYHPQLIPKLQEEHQLLLAIFGAIQSSFQSGDRQATAKHLSQFRTAVHSHLLTENVRLYLYLGHALSQDPVSKEMMQQFRREMDGIGKTVMAFLDKYKDIDSQSALAAGFADELAAIGGVLVDRIKREEDTLYPLYLPEY